jgi:hypothetical protein
MTLYDELGKVLKIKRKEDESFDSFTARATKKINALKDPEWNELTEELQLWHNETAKAREKENVDEASLPELEGWPGAEEEAADGEEVAVEANEGDEEPSEETTDNNAEEDVDAAAESEQEGDNEAAEAAASAKRASKKAKKPVVAAKPEKSAKSTQKEKETMPAKKTATAAPVAAKKKVANGAVAKAKAGRQSRLSETAKIKILVKENPHREGTGRFDRWRKYKEGMTVGQALKAGLKPANLHYSVADGHIKIVNA